MQKNGWTDRNSLYTSYDVFLRKGVAIIAPVLNFYWHHFCKCSAVAEMGDRLTRIDMGRKAGGHCAPFWEGEELDPHPTQCGQG